MLDGAEVVLNRAWTIGVRIAGGGFGQVYEAASDGESAVAKFVPKAPGAERELLFVDLDDTRNVVPVIDSGEHEGFWVLVMPRAEGSLRSFMESSGGAVELSTAIGVLKDVADALADLDGRVVHRDLKPENVLLLGGHWCLADFGISRYAEATTAPDTQKFALSPPYAAPERWRSQRATSAADIYAVGVVGFELITGALPFVGSSVEDYREAHLHQEPVHVTEAPPGLAALIDECLYKAPEARPTAANVRARLEKLGSLTASPGLAALQEANRAEVLRREAASRQGSVAQSESERREQLSSAGQRSFDRISEVLQGSIVDAAPAITVSSDQGGGWKMQLNDARLTLSRTRRVAGGAWGGWPPPVARQWDGTTWV